MRHNYCSFCDLYNQYAEKCTYARCPLDDENADEDAKAKAYDAYYMRCMLEQSTSKEDAAAERYHYEQSDAIAGREDVDEPDPLHAKKNPPESLADYYIF